VGSLKGRNRLEDLENIKMDLKKIILESMNWIHLAKDRGW
jgi:hypothetical protein